MLIAERLLAIRDKCASMLARAQDIRIQQVQATNEADWGHELRDRAEGSWRELNVLSESVEAELAKIAAELNSGHTS